MQDINEFLKENPKMRLKEISNMYGITVSAISKRRALLGIKNTTSDVCKKIATLLHKKNKDIAKELDCSTSLVGVIRFKEKRTSFLKVNLNEEQKELVRLNYNSMTCKALSDLIGVSAHVLRNRMAEMKLHNDTENQSSFYDYDLDNGNGFFDLEKYKSVML